MSCQRVLSILSDYSDGEVQAPDADFVKKHLAECASCAREFSHLRHTTHMLGSVPEIEPPAFLLEQIEAVTVKRPTFRTRLRTGFGALREIPQYARWTAAGAVAAGVLMLVLMHQPSMWETPRAPMSALDLESSRIVAKQPGDEVSIAEVMPEGSSSETRSVLALRPAVQSGHERIPKAEMVAGETGVFFEATGKVESPGAPTEAGAAGEAAASETSTEPKETMVAFASAELGSDSRGTSDAAPEVKSGQADDGLADLRAKIAARNRQRNHLPHEERIEGRKYSVELASIQF